MNSNSPQVQPISIVSASLHIGFDLIEYLVDHSREGKLFRKRGSFHYNIVIWEHVQDTLKLFSGVHYYWSVVIRLE